MVSQDDALIVAINPKSLGREFLDSTPPRIVQAAFPIGPPYVTVDANAGKVIGEGYQHRDAIRKASGKEVPTGAFLLPTGEDLSGLLCSRVDAANQPSQMGDDFQLVPNPLARALQPDSFRLPGVYFPVARQEDGALYVTLTQ